MSQPSRRGAYVGAFIGIHGWLIGLAIVSLAAGQVDFLLQVGPIGLAVSLAMAALAVVVFEAVIRAFGRGPEFQLVLWGMILLFIGVIVLLFNHWIAPLVESDPKLGEVLRSLGSVYKTPDIVPALCLFASAACSLIAVRRMLRRESDGGDERGEGAVTHTD